MSRPLSPYQKALAAKPKAPASPTAGDEQQLAEAAHTREQRIKSRIRDMRTLWVQLAGDLYEFANNREWDALGYQSFEQWLVGPEIELSRREVYYLIEAWRELVVGRGVKPEQLARTGAAKLREVMPAIRRGYVGIEQAISDCESLTREDLREHYGQLDRPGASVPPGDRPLDADSEPEYATCEACGSRYRVRQEAA